MERFTKRGAASASNLGWTPSGCENLLVRRYRGRKVFVILDNELCHWLGEAGRIWLHENRHRIELHRLPPYSPELNPIEGVWKTTRRRTTHNRFYSTVPERDPELTATFKHLQRRPALIADQLARGCALLASGSTHGCLKKIRAQLEVAFTLLLARRGLDPRTPASKTSPEAPQTGDASKQNDASARPIQSS